MADDQHQSITVASLFKHTLDAATRASQLSALDEEAQDLIQSCLNDLQTLSTRARSLSLFSNNESLDELSTKNMVFMFLPYVYAEVTNRAKTIGIEQRLERLKQATSFYESFIELLDDYDIVTDDDRKLYDPEILRAATPVVRREMKVMQYKQEKQFRNEIAALRKKHGHPEKDNLTEYEMIASLLPSTDTDSDDEGPDEEEVRELTTLLLRLMWTQAISQQEATHQEMELLKNAPPPGQNAPAPDADSDLSWRLDKVGLASGSGPLLDKNGKPLRPFTILPSGTQQSERARLQAEVFQPDHRLPTMTIDQYLAEEQRRGNIISGGGPASQNAPTSSEQLAIDAEQDGTLEGEAKSEEKRLKDEKWAQFTDTHRKGAGNTMNRG